jgi:hypothetical protein
VSFAVSKYFVCCRIVWFGLVVFAALANRKAMSQEQVMAGTVAEQLAARILSEHELRPQAAEAGIRKAASQSRWLDVELKQAESYWTRRIRYAVGKQAFKENQMAIARRNQKLNYAREWDLIKNNPNLVGPNIKREEALNFLFDRFNASILNYDYVNLQDPENQAFVKKFRLSPEMLSGIRLSQSLDSGERLVFAADGSAVPTIKWWPTLIRAESLAAARSEVDEAGRALSGNVDSKADTDAGAQRLLAAFENLLDEFYRTYPVDEIRNSSTKKVIDYRNAERFLKVKLCEVSRTPEAMTGQVSELRFDPAAEGDHLLALLKYMTKNGLEFAPPTQGNEKVYGQVFNMMRELFSEGQQAKELEGVTTGLDATLKARRDQMQPAAKP